MKTTLDLDDRLLLRAKARAARDGRTLTALVEDALRACLSPVPERSVPTKISLPTVRGRALPTVDITDRDALYDAMDKP